MQVELKGTLRLRSATAAQWTAADPILAAGEPGRETDTGRIKVGDGTTVWSALPCAVDPPAAAAVPAVPAVSWKVVDGMLCVSPNTPPDNPILTDCIAEFFHAPHPLFHTFLQIGFFLEFIQDATNQHLNVVIPDCGTGLVFHCYRRQRHRSLPNEKRSQTS